MKKKIALILALCLALTSFSACSSSSKKGSGRSSNDRDSKYDADDDDDVDDDDDSEPTRATRETTERKDPTPTPSPVPTEAPVQIKPTENASINWTTYESPDGYFKINVPEGWTVFYHDYDVISYEVVVYDNYAEKFFYFGTSFVSYPSEENFEYWMDVTASYGFETTEYGYISPEATALSLFENSGDRFGYTDFELIDTLGENGYGDYFLQANIKDMNNGRQFRFKVGVPVAVARRAGAVNAIDELIHYINYAQMIIPGSLYWPLAFGNKPGEVTQDTEGVQTLQVLAQSMAFVMKAMEAGKAQVPVPELPRKSYTNFIR